MDGLKVAELARRSGVPATTLRFYDAEGLLPARRSSSGYRLYDDTAEERLRFITTAKSLGLPLPEIRRLLDPWEHGSCADVQGELAPLLVRHIAETDDRLADLQAFADRLARAREQLAAIDRDGPCDPTCAVLGRHTGRDRQPVPSPTIACTLDASAHAERMDQWRAVLAGVTGREAVEGGVRLRFDPPRTGLGELAELAAAEVRCCAFLDITLHLGEAPTMEVRAPHDALLLIHELFGEPDA